MILFCVNAGPEGIRTLDLSDANRTLSQLSYKPIFDYTKALSASTTLLYTSFWELQGFFTLNVVR